MKATAAVPDVFLENENLDTERVCPVFLLIKRSTQHFFKVPVPTCGTFLVYDFLLDDVLNIQLDDRSFQFLDCIHFRDLEVS